MKIINMTPHSIKLVDINKSISIDASGYLIRINQETNIVGEVEGFPISHTEDMGVEITKNCEKVSDKILDEYDYIIVSSMLLGKNKKFIAPDTKTAIRNEDGQIIAVRGFLY